MVWTMEHRRGRWSIVGDSQMADLTCEECEAESEVDERAPGWRAHILTEPVSEEDPRRVIVCCPACAVREFAPDAPARDNLA